MVFFAVNEEKITPDNFLENCLNYGLRFSRVGNNRFRAVMHWDLSVADVCEAIKILKKILPSKFKQNIP